MVLRKMLAVLLAVVVAGVGVIAASCGGDEEEVPAVKIGGLYALSGPLAGAGETMRDGFLLAVKDINEQGGVLGAQVEIVIRDTKAMVDEAVVPGIVDEFITKENVTYVAGGYSDSVAATVQELTVYGGIPYLSCSPGGGVATRGENINEYKITWFVHPDVRAFCMWPYLLTNDLVPNEVILMGPDYGWGWDNNAAAKNAITQYGGTILKEIVTGVPTLDFSGYIAQFQQLAPQGATIFSSNPGAEQVALLKAIYDADLLDKGFSFVTSTMDNSVCHYGVEQEYLDGVWLGLEIMYDLPANDELWHDFVQRWYDEYQDYPDYVGVWEYFTNYCAMASMNETGSTDPDVWLPYMKDAEWKVVSDEAKVFSDVNGRLLKTEYLLKGKSPDDMVDQFPDISGIGAEWDHWEIVESFPVSYTTKILSEDAILDGVPVGDPSIGTGVKSYWE